MSELPTAWELTNLGALTSKPQYGFTTKSSQEGRVKYLRTTDLTSGKLNWESVPYCILEPDDDEKYQLEKNDIVISRAGSVGFHYLIKSVPKHAVFASYLIRFKPEGYVNPEYLSQFLKSKNYWEQLNEMSAGVAVQNVNAQSLSRLQIPVAPLNEQIRIANKLDSLLAKVDAAQARLEKIPTLLKRFRQSILASATSGELTREWREENSSSEWKPCELKDICDSVSDGDHQAPPKAGSGVPFLVISNVNTGKINFENVSRWVPNDYYDKLKSIRKPKKKDILYTVTGSFGIPVIVETDTPFCFQRHIAIIKPSHELVDYRYLSTFLSTPAMFNHASNVATGTAQKTVSLTNLRKFNISLPSRVEQKEIVRRVASLFALADLVEKQYLEAKQCTNLLTQSFLAKAFRGELVPQDPNDEPASELLKRIQAERTVTQPKKAIRILKQSSASESKTLEPEMVDLFIQRKSGFNEKPVKLAEATKEPKDSIYLKYSSIIDKASTELAGKSFSIEQFRSVCGFSGDYESLKALIMNLLKGTPGLSEPLLEIDSWDKKTGDYRLVLKESK